MSKVIYKPFKVAQIVPVSCLELTKDNQYHMCLANIAARNTTYADFYKRMAAEGKYVLMDNGAAEGEQLSDASLVAMYEYVNPTEIVVPDTLLDGADTLRKATGFTAKYGDLPYRKMFVPQGRTFSEWCSNARTLLLGFGNVASTIGISKFLNIATDDPGIRLPAARYIHALAERYGLHNLEIHLLGCDEGPSIVRDIQQEVPIVRGCDSAFAYVAAQAGTTVDECTVRPAGEIDFVDGPEVDNLAATMQAMANVAGVVGGNNGVTASWL